MTEREQRIEWNRQVIDEFRANEGHVGGNFAGAPLLLLHTRGARSSEERINPMMYLREGERVFVFGSNGGRDNDPGWYFNVLADPHVTVELGTRTFSALAQALDGAERDRVYAEQISRYPVFRDYQDKVARSIPVVELVAEAEGTP